MRENTEKGKFRKDIANLQRRNLEKVNNCTRDP